MLIIVGNRRYIKYLVPVDGFMVDSFFINEVPYYTPIFLGRLPIKKAKRESLRFLEYIKYVFT